MTETPLSKAAIEAHIVSTCPTTAQTAAEWIYGRPTCWGDERFVAAHKRAREIGDELIEAGRIERYQNHPGGTLVWTVPSSPAQVERRSKCRCPLAGHVPGCTFTPTSSPVAEANRPDPDGYDLLHGNRKKV